MSEQETHGRSPSQGNPLGKLLNPATILGAIGVCGLAIFVNKTSVFGQTCYHFGPTSLSTICLHPPLYFGAWAVSVGLLVLGVLLAFAAIAKVTKP